MEIILIGILTFLASFVGTITGFGSSTLMLPVIVLFFPLPVSLFFVGIIHTVNDIWKIVLFKHAINWKLILSFGIPGVIASIWGATLAVSEPNEILTRILGVFLVSYVLILVFDPKLTLPHNTYTGTIGGALSGFIAGIFGVGGPVRSLFLSAFNFPKDAYIFASGVIAFFIDISRLSTYYLKSVAINESLLEGLIFYIPISFIAAEIAKSTVNKIPQEKFRLIVAFLIFIVGAKLIFYP